MLEASGLMILGGSMVAAFVAGVVWATWQASSHFVPRIEKHDP